MNTTACSRPCGRGGDDAEDEHDVLDEADLDGCRELVSVLQLDRLVPTGSWPVSGCHAARHRVPAIPPIVCTSGVITVGRPGAERLTGSTRNSPTNPSSRRQNSVTCSTVRSVRWWEVVLDDRDQGAHPVGFRFRRLEIVQLPSVSRGTLHGYAMRIFRNGTRLS